LEAAGVENEDRPFFSTPTRPHGRRVDVARWMDADCAAKLIRVPGGAWSPRVDVVDCARGPLLMELELIESELYFQYVPEGAHPMADILVDRVRR
jgi:hypothetical protein